MIRTSDVSETPRDAACSREAGHPYPPPWTNLPIPEEESRCPVVEYLTSGRWRAPFLLVYAVRYRDSKNWERPRLGSSNPVIPLVFVSESLGYPEGFGRGPICYTDGSQNMGWLPLVSAQVHYADCNALGIYGLEIHFDPGDERFPYARDVFSIRVQYME